MLDVDALLSASEAARYAVVSTAAVVNWATRGYTVDATGERAKLPVATDDHGQEIRDRHGRPRYRLLDVAKAEAATHKRARRTAA